MKNKASILWWWLFSAALALFPVPAHSLQGWFEDGVVFLQQQEYQQAVEAFTQAIRINPKMAEAYSNRGIAWKGLGDIEKAITDFTRAITLAPRLAEAYCNRAGMWYMLGKWDKAVADCEKVLSMMPDHPYAGNQLAWIRATCPDSRFRDGAKALKLAGHVADLYPEPQYMDTLAAAQAEAGNYSEAAGTQEKLITRIQEHFPEDRLAPYRERLELYRAHTPYRTPETELQKAAAQEPPVVKPAKKPAGKPAKKK